MKLLDKKLCIITGASGEIGIECAKLLHKNGAKLILIYHKNKKIINSFSKNKIGSVFSYKCDLTNLKQIKTLYNKINKKFSEINVLINCAGLMEQQNFFFDMNEKNLKKHLDLNTIGTISMVRTFSRNLIRNKNSSIVNISSLSGNSGTVSLTNYATSKGAIKSFTFSAARELGPLGVRVNSISPGLIKTKLHKESNLNKYKNKISLNRLGKPEDVANLVLFLSSDLSTYINGEDIKIDGQIRLF